MSKNTVFFPLNASFELLEFWGIPHLHRNRQQNCKTLGENGNTTGIIGDEAKRISCETKTKSGKHVLTISADVDLDMLETQKQQLEALELLFLTKSSGKNLQNEPHEHRRF